ncbi:MAG: YfcC family protein [Spirochaetales bacterium]|nr:YfcC family protein [Spirochaetales bacterium]
MESGQGIKIGKKAFLMAVGILASLIIVSGILTRVLPVGEYERVKLETHTQIVENSYQVQEDAVRLPIYRWFTAPIEVLWGDNWQMVMVLLLFMIFMGGAFAILDEGGIIKHILAGLVTKFEKKKYLLMAVIIFVFMFSASVLGIFEAMLPMIVFVVPLAIVLGWDSLTGLGMSLLSVSFGFAAAVTNPFSIVTPQRIAQLPDYSGAWLRIIFFIVVYISVFLFVMLYAKKIEKDPSKSIVFSEDAPLRQKYSHATLLAGLNDDKERNRHRAVIFFISCMIFAISVILLSVFVPQIPNTLAFPVIAIVFLIAGIGCGIFMKMKATHILKKLYDGLMSMLPGIVLILFAMSIPHIMTRGGVMDTVLHFAEQRIAGTSPFVAVFLVYGVTLIMNFFVSSASAKAFLMIPILAPLADMVGITRQTAVMAYNFGDGFSNMFYPTNALLLIGLGLTVVSYPKWIRWSLKIQIPLFLISMAFLAFATAIGYGPF